MKKEHDTDKYENQMDHPDNFPLWCVAMIASCLCCMALITGVCVFDACIPPLVKIIFGEF